MPKWKGPGTDWGWQTRQSPACPDGRGVHCDSRQAARNQPARTEDVPGLAGGHGLQEGPGHFAHHIQCSKSKHEQFGYQMVTTEGAELCWAHGAALEPSMQSRPLGTGEGVSEALPSSGLFLGRTIALQNQRSLQKPWFLPLSFNSYCLSFPAYNGFLHSKTWSCKVHKPFLPGTGSVIPDGSYSLKWRVHCMKWAPPRGWDDFTPRSAIPVITGKQPTGVSVLMQLVWSNLGFTCLVKEKALLKDKWVYGEM